MTMIKAKALTLALLAIFIGASFANAPSPEQAEFFEAKIRPLLANNCYGCHSQKADSKGKLKAGLYLDSYKGLINGGDSGSALVPGEPDQSRIVEAVLYRNEDMAMPPKGKLSLENIELIKKWVQMGAPWPGSENEIANSPDKGNEPYDWDKFRNEHWAFKQITNPTPPHADDDTWSNTPIDKFIYSELKNNDLLPNGPATPQNLIRRAYLNLIGIPPTPQQVNSFLNDTDPDAFSKVIDQLLESKHYGERWARHWLDVARYSDGHGGFGDNKALPNAWRFRDWVVNAFNSDMPYNMFVKKQIAGDLIGDKDPVPTGFFVVGPTYNSDGGDPEAKAQALAETLSDRVDTFSRAFLGLTAACARCHNHKFDPITTHDYYSLAGIFKNTRNVDAPVGDKNQIETHNSWKRAIDELNKSVNQFLDSESKRLSINRKEVEKKLPEESKIKLSGIRAEIEQLKKSEPPKPPNAHVLSESGNADMHIALRGDLRKKGEIAPRRFIEIIGGKERKKYTQGSGRIELSESVISSDNPLTARVMVNRIWGWHFGHGLVRTPSNFGTIGEKPSHPLLLDWLAHNFIEQGWSMKALHKMILMSSTWQMSSTYINEKFDKDGDNKLLWRFSPRKLEVESWRDTLLYVTGELDPKIGGAPDGEILNSKRRTLYATISRTGDRFQSDAFLRLFDFPAAVSTSPKRSTSVVPQQYLFMMNSPFMSQRSKNLGKQLFESPNNTQTTIESAYQRLYSRLPEQEERELANKWLGENPTQKNWELYAQVLLSAHELIQVR
ncbi:MAG: PSD1 and planctomycete cytochrome C domain-containing protein [Verrucomicrobiota bacterium]|nr:PSD1 and planctomycete cytochrome C domain-containing protein [Verrucomicrobiota bacterium]